MNRGKPRERAQANLKKDLSRSFVNGSSRLVFINCGGTLPTTLDLFLQTYPQASDYHIVTILPDASYAPLYGKYSKHTMMAGSIAMSSDNPVGIETKTLGSYEKSSHKSKAIDLATWIKENFSVEDYVILKLDNPFGEEIAKSLMTSSAYNRIDKFYTTSMDSYTVERLKTIFQDKVPQVLVWMDDTYSDFQELNPPAGEIKGKIIRECTVKDNQTLTLLFYASRFNMAVIDAVKCLLDFAVLNNIVLDVFLPDDFYQGNYIYYQKFSKNIVFGSFKDTADLGNMKNRGHESLENTIRNGLIFTEGLLAKNGLALTEVLLNQVVPVNDISLIKLAKSRRHNIVTEIQDITGNINLLMNEKKFDVMKEGKGKILALDISNTHGDYLALFILNKHLSNIYNLADCIGTQ